MSASTPLLDRPAGPGTADWMAWEPPAPVPPQPVKATRAQIRQLLVGLIALPLTALPFVAYATYTPEGRLVRDRAMVAIAPPQLPRLAPDEAAAMAAAAPRYEGAVMALAYHGIGSASDGEGGFVISAERFGQHLAALKAAGMNTVTAAQVAAAFSGGEPLPPNAVMLSFDDGRSDAMMFADPLLEQAGMSATMFVIAGAASKPGVYYASWDRIEAYARSGRWDIESHTATSHREQKADGGESLPVLTSRARNESIEDFRARIHEDLAKATSAIEAHTGHRPVAFAYPFGAYGGDRTNDPAIEAVVRQEVAHFYGLAFQQDGQDTVPLLTTEQDRLRLRRVEVQDWSGEELLRRIGQAQAQPVPAADQGGAVDPAPPGADQAAVADGAPAAPSTTAAAGTGSAGARTSRAPSVGVTVPTVPGAGAVASILPPVATSLPPVNVTTPPVTVAPLPILAPPSTTVPPVTSPPTTRPPSTTVPPAPTTTVCIPIGNSGKCR